jgi:hypothetical protein
VRGYRRLARWLQGTEGAAAAGEQGEEEEEAAVPPLVWCTASDFVVFAAEEAVSPPPPCAAAAPRLTISPPAVLPSRRAWIPCRTTDKKCVRSILTEIYLRHACSCHEICRASSRLPVLRRSCRLRFVSAVCVWGGAGGGGTVPAQDLGTFTEDVENFDVEISGRSLRDHVAPMIQRAERRAKKLAPLPEPEPEPSEASTTQVRLSSPNSPAGRPAGPVGRTSDAACAYQLVEPGRQPARMTRRVRACRGRAHA